MEFCQLPKLPCKYFTVLRIYNGNDTDIYPAIFTSYADCNGFTIQSKGTLLLVRKDGIILERIIFEHERPESAVINGSTLTLVNSVGETKVCRVYKVLLR